MRDVAAGSLLSKATREKPANCLDLRPRDLANNMTS